MKPISLVSFLFILAFPNILFGEQTAEESASEKVTAAFAKASEALKIGPGEGYLKIGLLLQGWNIASIKDSSDWTDTFRIRRAEISVKGQLVEKPIKGGIGVGYEIVVDPARVLDTVKEVKITTPDVNDPTKTVTTVVSQPAGPISMFQHFGVTLLTDYADVSLGQFKIPISYEGFNSSGELIFAERARISREIGYKRDLGVKIEKRIGSVFYHVSIWNGAGQNKLDMDQNKDLAARVEFYPLTLADIENFSLMVGGAVYMTARTETESPNAKDRFEADLRFDSPWVLLQAEYIRARDYDKDGAGVTSQGFYAAVAGWITKNFKIAGRFGGIDQDVSGTIADKTWIWEAGGGLHWHPLEKLPHALNLKLDYYVNVPKTENDLNRLEHQVVLAAQVRF